MVWNVNPRPPNGAINPATNSKTNNVTLDPHNKNEINPNRRYKKSIITNNDGK